MSGPPPDPFYILRGGGSPVTAVIFGFIREEQHLFSGYDVGSLVHTKLMNKDHKQLSYRIINIQLYFSVRDDKGIIRIWNLSTKRTDKILNGHDGKSIINLQWLKDDKLLR